MVVLNASAVLVLNAGSSSLKFAVYETALPLARRVGGVVRRVGLDGASLTVIAGDEERTETLQAPDHATALEAVLERVHERGHGNLAGVGHRIVHGGEHHDAPCILTPDVLVELRRLSALDPAHLPAEIAIVEAIGARRPSLAQVGCFDTAFHASMPRLARILPIPRRYEAAGVRRYGFHGLSYTFLVEELARQGGAAAANGRVVLAHLGAGASLATVYEGRCVDTTMAFTPNSGIPMSTRSGDLDPGVLLHLMRTEGLSVDAADDLLSRRSGLLGISETSPDMHELLACEESDPRAAEAVAFFCHSTKKAIGALATTLGGMDTLVFAGGIGENAPAIRARIARGLEHLGVQLDARRNDRSAGIISVDDGRCTVRVIRTDEEIVIARETIRAIHGGLTR